MQGVSRDTQTYTQPESKIFEEKLQVAIDGQTGASACIEFDSLVNPLYGRPSGSTKFASFRKNIKSTPTASDGQARAPLCTESDGLFNDIHRSASAASKNQKKRSSRRNVPTPMLTHGHVRILKGYSMDTMASLDGLTFTDRGSGHQNRQKRPRPQRRAHEKPDFSHTIAEDRVKIGRC